MAQDAPRTRYNFNPAWLVAVGDAPGAEQAGFDDHAWKHVSTPYAWNEDSAFKVSIHDLPTGVAWYRKHFSLPANAAGQKVFLEFEGIRQGADIYLNGKLIGRHEDGVSAFGIDLGSALQPGENVLAVKTDNRWDYREQATNTPYQWNDKNFYANYGGIGKNVWLHVLPRVYQTLPLYSSLGTTGVYIYASDFDIPHRTARITVESEVKNETGAAQTIDLGVRLLDAEGKPAGEFKSAQSVTLAAGEKRVVKASAVVNDLHLWSWGYGYLYNVVSTVSSNGKPLDTLTTRTGFRQTAFRNGMIYLNGRVLQVHGYAQRTTNEWPAVGLSVPPWMSDLSNRLMVESNGNVVRWMHVTPWKQDVESSDRVGLIESMPAGDSEGDPSGRRWTQRVELMRDSIVYNRNNPSILFYESGNKGVSEEHMLDMKKVRDEFDPHGGRASGSREMLASKTAEYGGEMLYINKSTTKPVWAHEYNRDEGARKFWDDDTAPFHKDSPSYNRNQDSAALEDVRRWDEYYAARPGTGTRVSSGGVNIVFADSNTHYRGDNNYRRSGEVDAMRIPKEGFYAHQVIWNGWVDIEHPGIHIVGHWNYADKVTKPVYVVATAARVELKLDGRSLGFATPVDDFIFVFNKVTYHAGKLEAIGYGADGKVLASTSIETAGAPTALRLTPHVGPAGLRADGADMAAVDVEVVDAQGRRCPTALNMIRFTLDGAAEWRGGIAQGSSVPVPLNPSNGPNPTPLLHEDNYILAKTLPVEGGVNRVLLRALPSAGAIHLKAEADGLQPATIELASKPVAVEGGLSRDFPAADQPLNLERGPTPPTPSYTAHRVALPIVAVKAGANNETAIFSLDDNETTEWTSAIPNAPKDNKFGLFNAWIEYTLASPSTPTQVDLKLANFRVRRYPLKITLDGKTVWEGLTPSNLGYCTLPLKPATGTHLKIELTGAPIEGSETPALVEVSGKVDQAAGKTSKPVLSIVEAEIYTGK
ncbi:Beta-galactosidase/beta-glucuronidase [Granulicella rosea]|uniref:Beta-galactosidase/beta-glucuronidase n=2 Tax=Granulicella rosea TaxID=474952 RepID=A0A239MHC3_9BACT|nr:Beta-galactosidase/beta-glucuronidase [Granulicella rosea]